MKVLIVDDDSKLRRLFAVLLREHFTSRITEAEDGIQALAAVRKDRPDVILLDIGLGGMNGIEVLDALRAEPAYVSIPVIVISGIGDAATVRQAIALGVEDYLVKPFGAIDLENRLRKVFARLPETAARRAPGSPVSARADGTPASRMRLLLVDRDVNFRELFCGLFETQADIVTAEFGGDGLRLYREVLPDVVLLGEGLTLPNEKVLARKLRSVDTQGITRLYLCTERDELGGDAAALFDGFLRRSFLPENLRREFARLMSNDRDLHDRLLRIVRDDLPEEVATGTRQTLGVTMMQEVSALDPAAARNVTREVSGRLDLEAADGPFAVRVEIATSRAVVERLAELMLGAPTSFDDGAGDALGEILNTIAGRVRASFDVRDTRLAMGLPVMSLTGESDGQGSPVIVLPFVIADGSRFVVSVGVVPTSEKSATRVLTGTAP